MSEVFLVFSSFMFGALIGTMPLLAEKFVNHTYRSVFKVLFILILSSFIVLSPIFFMLLNETNKSEECLETKWGNILIEKVEYGLLPDDYFYKGDCK